MRIHLLDLLVNDVVLTREVLAAGLDDKLLTRAVREGVLVRILHGVYAEAATWKRATPEQRHRLRCAAVVRRYGNHVALSFQSAVVSMSAPTWGMDLRMVHLTHMSGNGRKEAGIVHHRGSIGSEELFWCGHYWVTNPARTAVDVASASSVEVGMVLMSYLLHENLTSKEELVERSSSRVEWPGTLKVPLAVSLADRRYESVGESRCGYMFWKSELPKPVPQFEVHDDSGKRLGRVDFAWPELGVIVEFDGFEKYQRFRRPGESVVDMVVRERRRENRIQEEGWTIIRLIWSDLAHPDEVVRRILAAADRRRSRRSDISSQR